MVWLNTQCANHPPATKDSFGGSMCTCPRCNKDKQACGNCEWWKIRCANERFNSHCGDWEFTED